MIAFCQVSTAAHFSSASRRLRRTCCRNDTLTVGAPFCPTHRRNRVEKRPGTGVSILLPIAEERPQSRISPTCTFTPEKPARVAVLVSGGGRSLENICEKIDAGTLTCCGVSLVIASKKTAGAIEKAERRAIPTSVLRLRDFERDTARFSDAISNVLDEYNIDLVVLAGWMHFYLIPPRYEGKVVNIHPSLIPAFCGKGYYGHRVHEAVLEFGAKVTGCTVHLADNKYDHGPIILQKAVPVLDSDYADDLAARVFEAEKEALPEAIQMLVAGKLWVDGRLIRVRSESVSKSV